MSEQHAPTTVPLQSQLIQNGFRRFPLGDSVGELFPQMTDRFSTGEAPYRNDHDITGKTSVS